MPYVDYAEWFRREQKRRQQATTSPSGAPQVITQTNTPTSFEQIGGRAVEIGKEELKGEIRNRVAEALAPSAAPAAKQTVCGGYRVRVCPGPPLPAELGSAIVLAMHVCVWGAVVTL